MSSSSTTSTAPQKLLASSLAAACDNVERPNEARMGHIENVEAYILANAPLKFKNVADDADQQTKDSAEQEKYFFMLCHRDGEGRTALHWSVALKNFDLARALLAIAGRMRSSGVYQKFISSTKINENGEQQQQHQQKQQNESEGSTHNGNNNDLIAPWALPPDSNSTTVLATACAVSASIEFITELILQATGQQPSSLQNTSSSISSSSKAMMSSNSSVSQQHPFISTPDAQGNTALHLAASRGNIKLAAFLINSFNADPREQNKKSQTALHRIVARGDTNAVEELIIIMRRRYPTEVKKFVNAPDRNGDTALHYASMEENREIGEFLLRNGADRNIKNKNGKEYWQL